MYRTTTLVLLGVKTAKLCRARQVALTQHSLFKAFVELKNAVKMTKCIVFKWTHTLAIGTMIAIISVIFESLKCPKKVDMEHNKVHVGAKRNKEGKVSKGN